MENTSDTKNAGQSLTSKYSKKCIEDLYITQNLNVAEVCSKLNITPWSLHNLLREYSIKKPMSLIVQCRERTSMERYGVRNPSMSPEIVEKIKQVNIEKYGKASYAATQEGIAKGKQTKLERYGDPDYNNMSKNERTKQERYGNSKYNNREKLRETCQERYGVDNPFQVQRVIENNREKKIEDYTDTFKEIFCDRDKAIEFLSGGHYNYLELSKLFNAPYNVIQSWVVRNNLREYIDYSFNGKSFKEDEVLDYVKSLGITNIVSHYKLKSGQEIDIYLPDFNLGIEFNGTYWHSSLFKPTNYHFEKSKEAEKEEIRLIHIYQYEWDNPETQSKIKSLLRIATNNVNERIYARDCEIKEITNREAKPFNEANHLQGHRNAQVTYGLFYEGNLVQLMSFSKAKYNRNLKDDNSWEIIRGCPGSNNIVIGGVSKLFTHFLRDYNPSSVFSYCDFNKFDGKGYEALGMKFSGYTGPDMSWIIHLNDYTGVVKRDPHRRKELKEVAITQIYGAGSKKYIYVNDVPMSR